MKNPKFEGFNRIVINHDGEAVSPKRAQEMGIVPDVGFMRNDGWSIGAEHDLRDVAFHLWEDEWKWTIKNFETEWSPIE